MRTPRTWTSPGTTPYEDYVQADVLTHLQHLRSDDPGEMVFLVTTQVMELWFTVIVHEWETATRALREDRIPVARDALKRSLRELEALNESWRPLAGLTPAQFNSYRGSLGEGSGFPSAMYRRMEFLLGDKSASMRCRTGAPPGSTPSWRRRSGSPACTTRPWRCWPGAGTRPRVGHLPGPDQAVRALARGRGRVGGDLRLRRPERRTGPPR
ncbi:Tryptophan 2,3-dioxygenase [Streptomyces californicus]